MRRKSYNLRRVGILCKQIGKDLVRADSRYRIWLIAVFSFAMMAGAGYTAIFHPPADFPKNSLITIEKGLTLTQIAEKLESEKVIRYPFWFRNFVTLFSGQSQAIAGNYFFSDDASVIEVAKRIANGEFGLEPVRVTIPEGSTNAEIAKILSEKIPEFDARSFLEITKIKEGRLFPDTYFFLPSVTAKEVLESMEANFARQTREAATVAENLARSFDDVLVMASLLEEEARTLKTRRMIAGILWKRLDLNMPLQVDAVFPYIIGKNTYEVTREDLQFDSPYNTYKYTGLPPYPITNPGLEAIQAALTPIETEYLFYLSDRSGRMYYAETFEDHVVNKQRYLNRI